jgi:Zn finger protein HypA/HybF involved in hydrogenase expression
MKDPDRITISEEFIERDGHMIPRNRRMKCARCEKWMTVDQFVARQYCPRCGEALALDVVSQPYDTDPGAR